MVLKHFLWRLLPAASSFERDGLLHCCIASNMYGSYCVPITSSNRPAAQAILRGEIYEPDTIEFLRRNHLGGDIVHAGTYFGDFLPALSRAVTGDAQIWAFEPQPENYRCASITLQLNDIRNVQLMNAGLGEFKELRVMVVRNMRRAALGGASYIVGRDVQPAEEAAEVEVVALDDVIPPDRNIAVIQLDVEGFERQALAGALRTIQRCLPALVLERPPDREWLAENILAMGYRPAGKLHKNTVFRP